jgi:hypothetical protein
VLERTPLNKATMRSRIVVAIVASIRDHVEHEFVGVRRPFPKGIRCSLPSKLRAVGSLPDVTVSRRTREPSLDAPGRHMQDCDRSNNYYISQINPEAPDPVVAPRRLGIPLTLMAPHGI